MKSDFPISNLKDLENGTVKRFIEKKYSYFLEKEL